MVSLDPETRRLADRGAKELLGFSLDRLVTNLTIAGERLDEKELDGLMLAGRAAEEINCKDGNGGE